MSEAVWYIYQNSAQSGPFSIEEIQNRLSSNMISQDAYLYKVGWKDWRTLEDCAQEGLTIPKSAKPNKSGSKGKLDRAPRATIEGQVIVHNNGHLSIGSGVNISTTGMFVETGENIFNVGETLKVTCRADGHMIRPFNAVAKVVRFTKDERSVIGYGLQFIDLDSSIRKEIQKALNRENAKRA